MRNRILFGLAALGVLVGLLSAAYMGMRQPPQPPAFSPASNPYAQGVYASGIIESAQAVGQNVDIYPEVAGTVVKVSVPEGAHVQAGATLVSIDASVQQAIVAQQQAQADAARALLEELRKQPRPEALAVAQAQVDAATATARQASDQLAKLHRSFDLDPRSVSKDVLDNASNGLRVAEANLEVSRNQYLLIKAGAWEYDIRNQEKVYEALRKQAEASNALLQKYTLRAPVDGIVLALHGAVGAYVSPQGTFDSYTQGATPVVVMSSAQNYLGVRVYVDEILVSRLPPTRSMVAEMQVRGTDVKLPLEFVRVQPYVSPKVELSDQRQERVDVRVLPVLFRFEKPDALRLYPGQLVDVYIRAK